jgi:hypothetical protein
MFRHAVSDGLFKLSTNPRATVSPRGVLSTLPLEIIAMAWSQPPAQLPLDG